MTAFTIHRNLLPYAGSLQARQLGSIDLIVIHCTELPDLVMAREFGEEILYAESATGNAGHYYVDQSGRIEEWVPLERVAHHVRRYNLRSVGIELVNPGRYPNWLDSRFQNMTEPYTEQQIAALLHLLQQLERRLPALVWISGHENLDTGCVAASDDPSKSVRRKLDPGPLFPWLSLLEGSSLELLEGDSLEKYPSD